MNKTGLSGAIFDIDGTLVDSRAGHLESWMKTFTEFGISAGPEEIMSHFGQKATHIAGLFAPRDWPISRLDELVDFKRDYFRQRIMGTLKPFPRVFELLDFLKKEGYFMALFTSASAIELELYKVLLRYDQYFQAAISGDDVQQSKPDPEGLLKINATLALPADEIVVLGDSPHDMKAAISAGMKTIAVTSGGYGFTQLLEAGASKIFADIAEIVAKLPLSLEFS